jgi:hypothetical protein
MKSAHNIARLVIALAASTLLGESATAISLEIPGTNLSFHVGEGGPPVRQNGPVFKSPQEIFTNVVAGAICGPPCVAAFNNLSPADKQNAINAVSTGGVVLIIASDPVLGLGLALLTSKEDSGGHTIQVHEHPAPPTGKVWSVSVDCIAQRQSGAILAFTKAPYSHFGEISSGDKVSLSAPICQLYNGPTSKSITAIDIIVTGLTTDDAAKPGDQKYYIDGNPG